MGRRHRRREASSGTGAGLGAAGSHPCPSFSPSLQKGVRVQPLPTQPLRPLVPARCVAGAAAAHPDHGGTPASSHARCASGMQRQHGAAADRDSACWRCGHGWQPCQRRRCVWERLVCLHTAALHAPSMSGCPRQYLLRKGTSTHVLLRRPAPSRRTHGGEQHPHPAAEHAAHSRWVGPPSGLPAHASSTGYCPGIRQLP